MQCLLWALRTCLTPSRIFLNFLFWEILFSEEEEKENNFCLIVCVEFCFNFCWRKFPFFWEFFQNLVFTKNALFCNVWVELISPCDGFLWRSSAAVQELGILVVGCFWRKQLYIFWSGSAYKSVHRAGADLLRHKPNRNPDGIPWAQTSLDPGTCTLKHWRDITIWFFV